MPDLSHLPTESEGFEGLMKLVDIFGEVETYNFLAYVRDDSILDGAPQVRGVIFASRVDRAMEEGSSYDDARREVAAELGYTPKTRTNGYKVEDIGRRFMQSSYTQARAA